MIIFTYHSKKGLYNKNLAFHIVQVPSNNIPIVKMYMYVCMYVIYTRKHNKQNKKLFYSIVVGIIIV